MYALHMGALHPVEKILTLVLAFGPFLLLAAVIMIRRRQDAREGTDATETPDVETDGAAEGEGRVHRDR